MVDSFNKIDNFNESFLKTFPLAENINIYDDVENFTHYLKTNCSPTAEPKELLIPLMMKNQLTLNTVK